MLSLSNEKKIGSFVATRLYWLTVAGSVGLASSVATYAQQAMPPSAAAYGECYGRATTPDLYETYEKEVLVRPSYTKTVNVPPVYESVEETVLVKEAYTEYLTIPAVYETVSEQVVVKEASPVLVENYETIQQTILVDSDHGKWVQKKDPKCFAPKPEDCYIMVWEKVAARYDTLTEKRLTELSSAKGSEIPPKYQTISKRMLKTPARIQEIYHEAVYKTVSKAKLVSPAKTEYVLMPAEYKKIAAKRLVQAGGAVVWEQIMCPSGVNANVVRQIQLALRNKGYVIKIDGIWGNETRNSLELFQRSNGLPVGNINQKTLAALYMGN